MKKNILIALFLSLTFFIALIFSSKDYGISWDSPTHFKRGQAYVHYYLTWKLTYDDVTGKRSIYQNDIQNGKFWLNDTYGHPPLEDNLSALSNYVFYQKFGLVGDIESHNLVIAFCSSMLIFFVSLVMLEVYGLLPALVAGLGLGLYPLFWAESHFNIKDPIETAFFSITLILFYFSLKKWNWKILLASLVFFGFSLATKLNAVFIPVIVLIYLYFLYRNRKVKIPRNYIVTFFLGCLVSLLIFYFSWPALWGKGLSGIASVMAYYKSVGSGVDYQPGNYYILGVNLYPILAVLFTTPPILLISSILGIFYAFRNSKKLDDTKFWLLSVIWLVVPLVRASIPGTSIYGGVRQIMEYIPPLAILSGIGVKYVAERLNTRVIIFVVFAGLCLIPIIKYHPNENVYFNFLIGGLKGASANNFPSWGNSFGNAYKQGITWINSNAPDDSKLMLLQGELANAPAIWLRSDINYSKENYSGSAKKGEYIMELTFDNTVKKPRDEWDYVETSLKPVYQVEEDGVAILTIWKNDNANSIK